jgi:thiol-disulfide isomerase/thioredoxin
MKKKITTALLCFLTASLAFAGKTGGGMDIRITVKGLENSTMILANYYGDKQYVRDTVHFDSKGSVVFKSDQMHGSNPPKGDIYGTPGLLKCDSMIPGGVYLAVFPALGNRYFEFIIAEPQFSIETDTIDMAKDLKIAGSQENKLFYDDMHFLQGNKTLSDSIAKLYKAAKDPAEKDKYRSQLQDIDKQVREKRNSVMTQYPDLFYAKMLNAMKDITVPDPPKDANGKIIDSAWQWRYYKTHYWDNVDLLDDRLLRCPVFHNKLKTFMTQTVVQIPDSINAGGDELIDKTDKKGEIYRYIITYIFNEMANSKVMGFDASYVHFGKKYFCAQPTLTPWVDTAKTFKICDRVTRLEPVLVGKKAQKLILPSDSTENVWKSLYDIKAKYTILVFWDPDCGHCKKELPVLADAYHDLKKKGVSVEGFGAAIMEMENYKAWEEFIKKNNLDWINVADPHRHSNFRFEWDIQSTPQIYILDQDKVIRARRIGADQVEDYILHLENPSYKGKLIKVNDDDNQEGVEEKK